MNEGRRVTDGGSMAAYVQGALLASALALLDRLVVQPVEVDQGRDADGNYEPFFRIKLASGIVLRVDVTVESEAR